RAKIDGLEPIEAPFITCRRASDGGVEIRESDYGASDNGIVRIHDCPTDSAATGLSQRHWCDCGAKHQHRQRDEYVLARSGSALTWLLHLISSSSDTSPHFVPSNLGIIDLGHAVCKSDLSTCLSMPSSVPEWAAIRHFGVSTPQCNRR